MVDWTMELKLVLQVLFAFFLGGLLGWERESHGSKAGIRTFGAMALGSCVFGLVSLNAIGVIDSTRVAAQVVTGVSFICAGVIFKVGDEVAGLTTAATLWTSAAIGLSVAYHMYIIAILTTFLTYLLLYLPRFSWWKRISKRSRRRAEKSA